MWPAGQRMLSRGKYAKMRRRIGGKVFNIHGI
jgi:hypothetical protein